MTKKTLRFTPLLWTGLLALLLSACAVYVTPNTVSVEGRVRFGIRVTDIIQIFEPTRGTGATYYVGEEIAFRVLTDRSGYLTLTAIDPDGTVYTFARNLYVRGGRIETITGPDASSVFSLVPPRGLHRVRAIFTPNPTSGRVRYQGVYGEEAWSQAIRVDVEPYDVRDVAETYFYLR